MPYIHQDSINQHPLLNRFLETSSTDDDGIDNHLNFSLDKLYLITVVTNNYEVRKKNWNLVQICVFLGKLKHLQLIKKIVVDRNKRLHIGTTPAYFPYLPNDPLAPLKASIPISFQAMIRANNYSAFRYAALNGRLDVMKYLVEHADNVLVMIQAYDFLAYSYAASEGHVDVLIYLEEIAPDKVLLMIQASHFYAFNVAASKGHVNVLKHLAAIAPYFVQAMIKVNHYFAYRQAAQNGHLDVLIYLESIAPYEVPAMIQESCYFAYRKAAQNGHLDVVYHLLTFPQCFAFAESSGLKYGEKYISSFVEKKLNDLQAQKKAAERDNPKAAVFNVEGQDQMLYFYILRHLIRQNNPALLPQINEILTLPSVQALMIKPVNQGPPNELPHLANAIGNKAAVDALMNIPAIKAFVKANYSSRGKNLKLPDDIGLSKITFNRKRSMQLLNQADLQEGYDTYPKTTEQIDEKRVLPFQRDSFTELYQLEKPNKRQKLYSPSAEELHHRLFTPPTRSLNIDQLVLEENEENKEQEESPSHKRSTPGECILLY